MYRFEVETVMFGNDWFRERNWDDMVAFAVMDRENSDPFGADDPVVYISLDANDAFHVANVGNRAISPASDRKYPEVIQVASGIE